MTTACLAVSVTVISISSVNCVIQMSKEIKCSVCKYAIRGVCYCYVLHEFYARFDAVDRLHEKINGPYDNYICKHCSVDEYLVVDYPCPTIKALAGERE